MIILANQSIDYLSMPRSAVLFFLFLFWLLLPKLESHRLLSISVKDKCLPRDIRFVDHWMSLIVSFFFSIYMVCPSLYGLINPLLSSNVSCSTGKLHLIPTNEMYDMLLTITSWLNLITHNSVLPSDNSKQKTR